MFSPKYYRVCNIEGEYAYLRDLSGQCTEDLFIAMSLLPPGTDLGTTLCYQMPEYRLVDERDN